MAKKVHTIVRLDKIGATDPVESVYFDEDLDVGIVAELTELAPDGESRKGEAPSGLDKELVFMAPVPMSYDDNMLEEEFYMEAGRLYRGYTLYPGRIVTITDDAFDAKPEVGDIVVPKVGSFGYEIADKDSNVKFKVISDMEFLAGYPATVLRVI